MLSENDKLWIQRQLRHAIAEITGRPYVSPLDPEIARLGGGQPPDETLTAPGIGGTVHIPPE